VLNLPNALTLVRLGLVPVMAYFLARSDFAPALVVFLAAALTDLADGYIARRFRMTSRLGALLDPIADKLNMFVATLLLALGSLLPVWLAIAIVARDVVIVGGAVAYRAALGSLKIAPTRLSKVNTFLEFGLLILVMAIGAGWIAEGPWTGALFVVVLATVIASGAQYVWLWGRKARKAR
jgi:cardiolipin synthase